MFNINNLTYFIKVAELGSFSKAAEELYTTSNAVMNHINNLEKELDGVKLFDRTNKGNKLTSAGISFYNDAKDIIQLCEKSKDRAIEIAGLRNNTIRFGVSYGVFLSLFQDKMLKVRHIAPELNMELIVYDAISASYDYYVDNLGDKIDLLTGIIVPEDIAANRYQGLEIVKVPIYAVMDANHPLAGKKNLTIEDLRDETVLVYKESWAKALDDYKEEMKKDGRGINLVEYLGETLEKMQECVGTDYILLSPYIMVSNHPFLVTVPLEDSEKSSYGFLYSMNPSPAVQKLIDILSELNKQLTR